MYHSRIIVRNDSLQLAVDAASGELVELTDLLTGDNLIKNHLPQAHLPFNLLLAQGDEILSAYPSKYAQIMSDQTLKPDITVNQDPMGQHLRIRYPALSTERGSVAVQAVCEIVIPDKGGVTTWRLRLDNQSGTCRVEKVNFPSVHGIYLGASWDDDTLVVPYFSGEKTVNPIAVYAREPVKIGWKWQEYRYIYLYEGRPWRQEQDGLYYREMPYSGPLSMMWLDYADPDHGLYLACHQTDGKVMSLRTETFGPHQPGMGLSIVHHPELESGIWQSPDCVVALHAGDWHWGADFYRENRSPVDGLSEPSKPAWFDHEPGLAAHYDFKYQHGGIVHRFADIPEIYTQAKELGLNFLLLSGWHQDGFDNGFPEYRPDPDLGSEQALTDALEKVNRQGGHVIFYVNARLSNMKYDHRRTHREDVCTRNRDGSMHVEQYGDRGIRFATCCSGSVEWQRELAGVVTYLTGRIGAAGVYLDQLGMAPPVFCHHPGHNHHPADWNRGYQAFFKHLQDQYPKDKRPVILYEGVTDLYGAGVSGQLISTFVHHHLGAFPELYRYTYPEQMLVDMLYPQRNLAMRPVHVAQQSRPMMDRAFITGLFYWVYDLEEDNTFRKDPESYAYLQKLIRLRRVWLERYGHGLFRDTEGILSITPGMLAKHYVLPDRSILLAVANPKGDPTAKVCLDMTGMAADKAWLVLQHTAERPEEPEPIQGISDQNQLTVQLSSDSLSLLLIRAV